MISKIDLEMLGEAALKFGISRLIIGDLDISFRDIPNSPVLMDSGPRPAIGEKYGMPTEDELLFASSIPLTADEIEARPPHG